MKEYVRRVKVRDFARGAARETASSFVLLPFFLLGNGRAKLDGSRRYAQARARGRSWIVGSAADGRVRGELSGRFGDA